MAKIVAVASQKGGVGKTSTASALAAGLVQRGFRALAIDLDPQGNLSDSIGAERSPGIYEAMRGQISAVDAIQHFSAFDIIAADIALAQAEREFEGSQALKGAIEAVQGLYEYIVLDTPPNLGVMTVNALAAADEIVIPATPGIFEVAGIGTLCEAVQEAKRLINPGLTIAGVLFTRFNARTRLSSEVLEAVEGLSGQLGAKVYATKIRASVDVGASQASQESIFGYKKKSKVARDYSDWVDEYLKGGK